MSHGPLIVAHLRWVHWQYLMILKIAVLSNPHRESSIQRLVSCRDGVMSESAGCSLVIGRRPALGGKGILGVQQARLRPGTSLDCPRNELQCLERAIQSERVLRIGIRT